MERAPSRWVLWLWAGALLVIGAYYVVIGDGTLLRPVVASYSAVASFIPLLLFWAVIGVGEMVDAIVNRRRGWGARLASSLVTTIAFTGAGLILFWFVLALSKAGAGNVVDPFIALVILPFLVIMVLAPLPAGAVNVGQAFASIDDQRRYAMLLAVAAVHCFPLLSVFINSRVVAGGEIVVGFVIALLLRAEGRERVGAMRQHSAR